MRVSYKAFPYHNRAFPTQREIYRPVLAVRLIYNHMSSRRIEAIVDTGSDYCLFHASIGEGIGIRFKSGIEGDLGGVIRGSVGKVYYHSVKLMIGQDLFEIRAGFSAELTGSLLGQNGFFDDYIVTFDPSPHPPEFEIQRISSH